MSQKVEVEMKTLIILILILNICTLIPTAYAEEKPAYMVELKWNNALININNNRDIILIDTKNCMIHCPASIKEGLIQYEPFLFDPNTKYIWVSVSGISNRISFLNYGLVSERIVDIDQKIASGAKIAIEGLELNKLYCIYKLVEDKIDPYFFLSSLGDTVIKLDEKIQPGKYLIVEREDGQTTRQSVIEVVAGAGQGFQTFSWARSNKKPLENRSGVDFQFLREYSEISALCELYYKDFRNSKYSKFAYSYGQTRPEKEKGK